MIFDEPGPGCITRFWTTQMCGGAKRWPRNIIIRIWWDDESEASVECPLGDFFGLGHGERIDYVSLPLQMSPQKGKGFNCWWPMPFRSRARIEIENDEPRSRFPGLAVGARGPVAGIIFYYYVDWEAYVLPGERGFDDDVESEPTLYGTGTEDYVNTAFCPQEKYSAPCHGIIKGGGLNWAGRITYYRYHIHDPIPFQKRIVATIERGHNNTRGDLWETTAYWYQREPHAAFPPLPDREHRKPG